MRMFAAVVPPPEALDHLDAFLDVRRAAGDFRWVQADQVHVTLAFLADVPERKVDDLVERLLATGFGLRVTGLDAHLPALLVTLVPSGPGYLTGGVEGPEGSLFASLALLGGTVATLARRRLRRA